MKTFITYYSYSGNTDKMAGIFAGILRQKGEVDIQRLRPRDEITSFLGQCMAARAGKRADLQDGVIFDASPYELVLLGCPVWAFAPTPAMNTYLDKISGLGGKRVIVLLTSGSGLGVKRCFQNIRKALEAKGAVRIDEINIPNRKQKDNDFVVSSLQKVL
jgi:flavodoxin